MGKRRPWLAGLMAAAGVIAMYRRELRPWMYAWGADDGEITATLPGDELVAAGTARTTRALTIDAPGRFVWPWLVQIGENRGGFYSYSLFERMVGAQIHNANTVHPEWQDLHVGDTVWLARRYGERARQVVAAVESESHLVLVSPTDFERVQCGEKASGAWAFCLRRQNAWTRLLVRGTGGAIGNPAFDVVHFVMEQKMMRGLRDRAERQRRDDVVDYLTQHRGDRGGIAAGS
ncbi:hypothetical protein [Mycolicibacterium gadium]|uniref:SRPBCC family protein n=1 Tax=Mycolicibacterium gadium TaxID=1794 RepID=A0ABT6GW74_MYCGU|nr:hypothetical protein [Mycolicibacterium gadium]MDG5485399.1 hypothetical protein [Mycolicibacterium gadium]